MLTSKHTKNKIQNFLEFQTFFRQKWNSIHKLAWLSGGEVGLWNEAERAILGKIESKLANGIFALKNLAKFENINLLKSVNLFDSVWLLDS